MSYEPEDAPDEQDYLDLYADDARQIAWRKWPEKWLEPLTPEEMELAESAFYDAWTRGLYHGREEDRQARRSASGIDEMSAEEYFNLSDRAFEGDDDTKGNEVATHGRE